jgi:hypothetical protein
MAYNPFDFFRRNQKTAFAALTIFVMFTFVLSFGQGDFFQWIPGWLGSFKNRGKEVLAVVDGRKVYDADLAQIEDNRTLANQFMVEMHGRISQQLDEYLRENVKTAGKAAQDALQDFLRVRPNYLDMRLIQLYQQNNIPLSQNTIQEMQQTNRQRVQMQIRGLMGAPTASSADQDLAKAATDLMRLDELGDLITRVGYFYEVGGSRGRAATNEDRLEFDLWLRKADKLGIGIRPDDAPAMVKEEFGNQLTAELWNAVEKGFGAKTNFSRAKLLAALADEFKVRTAFRIVMGQGPPAAPAYDVFKFYKEQTDAATYALMSVPAENFLDKVTAQPTEAELRELFDKYKNVEPDPMKETPGFREPRKLKLGWLEVTGTEPYFKKLGEDAFKLNEAGVRLAALNFGAMSPFTAPVALTFPDPQLQAAYAGYRDRFEFQLTNQWESPSDPRMLDNSIVRPQVVAAGLATLVGSHLTNGTPASVFVMMKERAMQFERNDRARVLAILLSPGTAAGSNALGDVLAAGAAMPKPLPLPVVRDELLADVKKNVTRTQAEKDLAAFTTELTRLGAKKDKSDARSYVDKYVAERGLKAGGSTAFHDQYSMGDDPGLAVLAEKKERGHGLSDVPIPFGPRFFQGASRDGRNALSFYDPQPYPDANAMTGAPVSLRDGEPTYLVWRTDVEEAKTPREFKDARAKVEAAWRRAKARELAKQAAEALKARIDERVKAEGAENQMTKLSMIARDAHAKFEQEKYGNDPAAMGRSRYFIIDKVAPIRLERPSPFDVQARSEQAVPFGLQHLLKKDLLYPTEKMMTDLLEAKDKPLGTTLLEANRPNDIYYVTMLLDRDRSDLEIFRAKNILDGMAPSQMSNAIRGENQREAFRKQRETVLALLKAEFKVTNESEKLKEKAGGSGE